MTENRQEKAVPCEEIPGMEHMTKQVVILRKLTFGDVAQLQDEIVQIETKKDRNGNTDVNLKGFKLGNMRLFALVFGIKSAPFFQGEPNIDWSRGLGPHHIQNRLHLVRNVDMDAGAYLLQQVLELNPSIMGKGGEQKNSEKSSTEKE